MKSYEFASLLCSRLCHDLLSPVGALNNGIELLADEHDPEMRARCLELLSESARASDIARARYREGVADFLALLDAERTQLQAENAVAQAESQVFTGVVGVYKALGGISE